MVVGGERRAPRFRACGHPPSYSGRDQTDQHPPLSLVYARPAPGFEPREVEKEKPLRLHPNMEGSFYVSGRLRSKLRNAK